MYSVTVTGRYKKDLKRIVSKTRPIEALDKVVFLLSNSDKSLPPEYKDHALKGQYIGCRECHIKPDWLLVYKKDKDNLILILITTGSHSDIF